MGRMPWARAAQQRKGEAVGDYWQRSYPKSAVDRSKGRSLDQQWQSSSYPWPEPPGYLPTGEHAQSRWWGETAALRSNLAPKTWPKHDMSNRVFRSSADQEILIVSPQYGGHRESQHVISHRVDIAMGQGQRTRGHRSIAAERRRDGPAYITEACRIGNACVKSWPSEPVDSLGTVGQQQIG